MISKDSRYRYDLREDITKGLRTVSRRRYVAQLAFIIWLACIIAVAIVALLYMQHGNLWRQP